MDASYVCQSWQALLQMIVHLAGRGYHFYSLTQLPESKRARWDTIDRKLIDRYQTDKSKFQRARRKLKKLANFFYLRWEATSVILHTAGDIGDIDYCDHFKDIRRDPMELAISELIAFSIGLDPIQKTEKAKTKVFVRLTRETYRGFKDELAVIAGTQNLFRMKKSFDRLNGLPAYAGIVKQKRNLGKYLSSQALKHGIAIKPSQLRIHTRLKKHKVYVSSSS